jgi:hypothetical protein
LTPKPIIQQINKKLVSNFENTENDIFSKELKPQTIKRYKKLNIKNKAPNCVQKNIR